MRRVWKSLRDEELPTVRVTSDDDSARKRPGRPSRLVSESQFSATKVEDLTKRERTSRMLHHGLQREKLRTGMPMAEHFLVVGARPTHLTGQQTSPSLEASSPVNPALEVLQPTILFQYPPGPLDEATQAVPGFCFPEGFVPQKIVKKSRRRTKESSHTPSRLAMMAASLLGPKNTPPPEGAAVQPTVTVTEEDFVKRYMRKPAPSSPGPNVGVNSSSSNLAAGSSAAGAPPPLPAQVSGTSLNSTASGGETPNRPTRHGHRRSPSEGEKLMGTLMESYLSAENSFVFLLTGHAELRYGICVMKDYIADANENDIIVQPLCFCVISAAPFLNFHHEFLLSLLQSTPNLCDMVTLDPKILDRLVACAQTAAQPPQPSGALPPPLAARPDGPSAASAPPTTPTLGGPAEKLYAPKNSEEAQRAMSLLEQVMSSQTPSGQSSMSESYELQFSRALLNVIQYCSLSVPDEMQTVEFFIGANATEKIEYRRVNVGFEEESELLMQFSGELLFHVLPVKVIIQLLTAVFLEYKVVLVSPHPKLLTAAVLALIPLCRPFEIAASVIPMMPRSLFPYLDAPVPLLVGMTSPPPQESLSAPDSFFCVVNLNTATLTTTKPLPMLPDQAALIRQLEDFLKRASVPAPPWKGIGYDVPEKLFIPTFDNIQRSSLAGMLQARFSEFVQDFERHCISDVGSSTSTTTVFIKESFVMTKDESQHEFLNAFLDTQMFKVYEDKKLRELDREKTEHRNSLRNGRRSATSRPSREGRPTRVVGGRLQGRGLSANTSDGSGDPSPRPVSSDECDASGSTNNTENENKPEGESAADNGTNGGGAENETNNDDADGAAEESSRPRRHRHHHHSKDSKEPKE